MKAIIEQKFLAAPFIMPLYRVTLIYKSVDEILACGDVNESF